MYCLTSNAPVKDIDVDQASTAASSSLEPASGAGASGHVKLDDLEEMDL